jgi:hypothetical protein
MTISRQRRTGNPKDGLLPRPLKEMLGYVIEELTHLMEIFK